MLVRAGWVEASGPGEVSPLEAFTQHSIRSTSVCAALRRLGRSVSTSSNHNFRKARQQCAASSRVWRETIGRSSNSRTAGNSPAGSGANPDLPTQRVPVWCGHDSEIESAELFRSADKCARGTGSSFFDNREQIFSTARSAWASCCVHASASACLRGAPGQHCSRRLALYVEHCRSAPRHQGRPEHGASDVRSDTERQEFPLELPPRLWRVHRAGLTRTPNPKGPG